MSIEGKHAYRFGYLKSEEWKRVRLEALVREKGKCQICGEESIYNDAHHIWYPENIYETEEKQLVILCRPCHELLHSLCPDCKTSDDGIGRETWIKFRNALEVWFIHRNSETGAPRKTKELRIAYEELRRKFEALHAAQQRALSILRRK